MKKTEITIQVFDDLETIISKLKLKGFKQVDKFELDDYYFSSLSTNVKQNYNELIKNSFLVRRILGKTEKIRLIYKNKEIDERDNVISEEKLEISLNDFEKTIELFIKVGLNNWCHLKQLNLAFKNKQMEILVQIVDDVGLFIEFEENNSMKNLTAKQKIDLMHSQIKDLGLSLGDDISCKKVYIKYLKNFDKI